jgi:hypothetical protein
MRHWNELERSWWQGKEVRERGRWLLGRQNMWVHGAGFVTRMGPRAYLIIPNNQSQHNTYNNVWFHCFCLCQASTVIPVGEWSIMDVSRSYRPGPGIASNSASVWHSADRQCSGEARIAGMRSCVCDIHGPSNHMLCLNTLDCLGCRWMAPATFVERGGMSAVWQQPASHEQRVHALQALLSCPT